MVRPSVAFANARNLCGERMARCKRCVRNKRVDVAADEHGATS